MSEREKGTVKFFNEKKGYGFITKEDIKEFYLGQQDEGVRGERRWKKKKMWR